MSVFFDSANQPPIQIHRSKKRPNGVRAVRFMQTFNVQGDSGPWGRKAKGFEALRLHFLILHWSNTGSNLSKPHLRARNWERMRRSHLSKESIRGSGVSGGSSFNASLPIRSTANSSGDFQRQVSKLSVTSKRMSALTEPFSLTPYTRALP